MGLRELRFFSGFVTLVLDVECYLSHPLFMATAKPSCALSLWRFEAHFRLLFSFFPTHVSLVVCRNGSPQPIGLPLSLSLAALLGPVYACAIFSPGSVRTVFSSPGPA